MATTTERVAYLLWQVNEGYLAPVDRVSGTNWFTEPTENLHPDDQAERPHWIALAEEVIAEVRRVDSGSDRDLYGELVRILDDCPVDALVTKDHIRELAAYLESGLSGSRRPEPGQPTIDLGGDKL